MMYFEKLDLPPYLTIYAWHSLGKFVGSKVEMHFFFSSVLVLHVIILFLFFSRMNIGGKVLTNHLKEVISYRQLHVMDETYVINQVKEDVCYVSNQFYKDMEIAK